MNPMLAALAVLCLASGVAAAMHHPLSPTIAVAACIGTATIAYRWSGIALAGALAAVPIIGFAPWSGWITFEELDLLVLAVAAGGYARRVTHPGGANATGFRSTPLTWLTMLLFSVSLCIAATRGIADAGGFHFGWFQGYHESMNSVRLAKSFLLALLPVPLWLAAHRASPALAASRLGWGMVLGLAGVSLAVLWERLAYTGLLNFSTDYRTTALFWEMHVGGAGLDGFLALTMPFAVLALHRARTPWRTAVAAVVLLGGAYACLTSFSRAVYAAVPLGVALTLWLAARSPRRDANTSARTGPSGWLPAGMMVLGFAAGAAWMFPTSGYRGMLALLGTFAVLLRLTPAAKQLDVKRLSAATALIAILVSAAVLATWWLPKGAYLAYGAACIAGLGLSVQRRTAQHLLLAVYLCTVVGIGLVAWHWGGGEALQRALPVVVVLAAVGVGRVAWQRPGWPDTLRWQANTLATLAVAGGALGVLGGGAYMSDRFSTVSQDFSGRIAHWREGLAMLDTPADWAFGKGLGRYPANHLLTHSATDAPGDYRLVGTPGAQHLVLTGGKHVIGWGELLRVSQRVDAPVSPVTVNFKVRAQTAQMLHIEVCEKHLLYDRNCLVKNITVEPTGAQWRGMQALLPAGRVSRGAWYAPRLIHFAVGNATRGGRLEIDDLQLVDGTGRNLLANGSFSDGMARWFFSSDRNHMPWHLKNLEVHTLFDQGAVGLALFGALVLGALWRTSLGRARAYPLAPAMAGAMVGFLVVGVSDSLLDMPRVAFVFYLLVLLALTLQAPRASARRREPTP